MKVYNYETASGKDLIYDYIKKLSMKLLKKVI